MSDYGNRYEKINRLGKGATGEVYLVRDNKTGQRSALKLLRPSLLGDQARSLEGFQKEFEILKDISHPNVAKVFDIGQDKATGKFYISTEFVDGKGLFEVAKNLSFDEIEDLFVQALRAFNYLQKKKIYHFDIKPDNILVTTDNNKNTVKVIDFGFANFFERIAAQDKDFVIGTLQFTAPEIIKCETPDGRADLYSLACTFYYAFTRKLPFEVPGAVGPELTVKIHNMHLNTMPEKLTKVNSDLPEYLDTVLFKMLNKNPNDRYETGEAVIRDLNLHAHKNYDVETIDTRLSYIPEKGQMIARGKELDIFGEYYDDRIAYEVFDNECCYLIVTGEKGAGKSRFVEECCNIAKRDFVDILSWHDFKKMPLDEVPEPCLVVGDDVYVQDEELYQLQKKVRDKILLVILTTDQTNLVHDAENVIRLNYFDKEQVREYLQKTSNIDEIPDNVVDIVYSYTHGSPLFITACMKVFFEKGLLKDEYGQWTKQDVEDLASLFDNLDDDVTSFIRENLKFKIESMNLAEGQKQLLDYLALTGKPTLTDITEITNSHMIEEQLQWFVENKILTTDSEHRYKFLNPLYKKVILDRMPLDLKQEYCDTIAHYYEGHHRLPEEIIYFKGRGQNNDYVKPLLELAKTKIEQSKNNEAIENFLAILERTDVDINLRNEAIIALSKVYLESGKYNLCERVLQEILDNPSKVDVESYALAQYRMSKIYRNQNKRKKALECVKAGLNEIKTKNPELKCLEVMLKYHLAIVMLEDGHLDESEKIFLEAWNIWENELSEEEQLKTSRCDIELVYYQKYDYDKAIYYLEKLLNLLENHKNLIEYPIVLYKLAETYTKMKELDKAEPLLKQCLEGFKVRKVTHYLFAVYNALGNLSHMKHDYNEAYNWYKRAADLALKTSLANQDKVIMINLANCCFKLGKLEEAKKYYLYALKQLSPDQPNQTIYTLRQYFWGMASLIKIYLKDGDLEEAKKYIERAERFLEEHDNFKTEAQLFWQEKANYEKSAGELLTLTETLKKLDSLKNSSCFSETEYTKWQKEFSEMKSTF